MKTSQRGIDLIKEFEGFRPRAYLCPGGVLTVGYGHTLGVQIGDEVTEEEAEELLRKDLEETEFIVNKHIEVSLTQNQFDAVVSLVYNIGAGNFYTSTIRKFINYKIHDIEEYRRAWMMWVKAQGKILKGLKRRREAEFKLFSSNENKDISPITVTICRDMYRYDVNEVVDKATSNDGNNDKRQYDNKD